MEWWQAITTGINQVASTVGNVAGAVSSTWQAVANAVVPTAKGGATVAPSVTQASVPVAQEPALGGGGMLLWLGLGLAAAAFLKK